MKKLIERHVPTNEVSEYDLFELTDMFKGYEIRYGEGFTEQAKGLLAGSIESTGDGFQIHLFEGDIKNHEIKEIFLDYSQAVILLGLLLLTHRDYKLEVSRDSEKLN